MQGGPVPVILFKITMEMGSISSQKRLETTQNEQLVSATAACIQLGTVPL